MAKIASVLLGLVLTRAPVEVLDLRQQRIIQSVLLYQTIFLIGVSYLSANYVCSERLQ